MSTENMQETRRVLIESFRNAQTETEKADYVAQMQALLTEQEKKFFADVESMASRIVHIDRTQKALETKRKEIEGIAQMLGFPIGEKIASGNFTAYMTDTVNNVDTDALAQMCEEDSEVAGAVEQAIEDKREKITLSTLTLTDLKTPFKNIQKTVPSVKVKQFRCAVRPVKD